MNSFMLTTRLISLAAVATLAFSGQAAMRNIRPPVPGTPDQLQLVATSPTNVQLNWEDRTFGEDGFIIERSYDGEHFTELDRTAPDTTAYLDAEVIDNKKVYYRVAAFDTTGKTPYSNIANILTPQAFYRLAGRVVEGGDFNPIPGAIVSLNRTANFQTPLISVNKPIPDNDANGITETFNVPVAAPVEQIKFELHITHSYIGDLTVSLVHPDGTTVVLHQGGGGADNLNTIYPDQTPPIQSLDVLKGKDAQGDWKLVVSDRAGSDTGALDSFQLTLTGPAAVDSVTTDANGYYEFPLVGSGTVLVHVEATGFSFEPRSIELHSDKPKFNFVSGF
ncbi:MAG: proprotein convertase P-domain-containing protein [Bdellovibrionales bacterium]